MAWMSLAIREKEAEVIYVFAVLALGLAIAAYRATERSTRIFLIICCLLNVLGIVKAVVTEDPYAFKLRPNDGIDEPPYRRP
jgi:hypothetical protein